MSAFHQVTSFFATGRFIEHENVFRAENRSEINVRLENWVQLVQSFNVSLDKAALIAAVLGELANNCFDHNLAKWTDSVGCLISFDFLPDRIRIAVADRGQGIANSLRNVIPNVSSARDLLSIAFEQVRAQEFLGK